MADKFHHLVSECSIVFAFLGNPKQGPLELAHVTAKTAKEFIGREDFIGLIGLSGLKARVALAVELDDATISALSQSFLALVEAAITRIEDRAGDVHKMSLP
jgi:hypothetical protein